MSIFIVTMYRWGDREKHSYVLGAYLCKEQARIEAEKEYCWRGGKYKPEIIEVEVGRSIDTDQWPTVQKLEDSFDVR